jgi:hypothetical protein
LIEHLMERVLDARYGYSSRELGSEESYAMMSSPNSARTPQLEPPTF